MGRMRHHTIVITDWDEATLAEIHATASALECRPSEIVRSEINGYASFFVPPDGSKEGWQDSERGDWRRARLVEALAASACDWVEIEFGGDSAAAIVRDVMSGE